MRTIVLVILLLAAAAVGLGGKFVSVRGNLIRQRQAIAAQWAELEVALARRADLIPDMVETVRQYVADRNQVFQEVAQARADYAAARLPQEKIQANERLSTALSRLVLLSESNPRLAADKDFQREQDEIAETENAIFIDRRKYNETLEHYNAQIQRFPDNVVASLSGFGRIDAYFKTEPGLRTPPKSGPQ